MVITQGDLSGFFLCGIHPSPCKENSGQGSFGVVKTSFSILKTSFSFLKFYYFREQISSLWKDFIYFCFKIVFFAFFQKLLVIMA